ncbi:MAG: DUF1992 domain-containing protein [Arenicellales bacterium]|nr:DUF1992 domain-containing protein [Arenicellales bacterium]
MWLIDELAEARIADAMRSGQFEDLAGEGERIPIEQVGLVPEELRVAYRLLKNSGYFPKEISVLNEISEVEQLIAGLDEGEQKSSAVKRLNLLHAQLGSRSESLYIRREYSNKIVNKFDHA